MKNISKYNVSMYNSIQAQEKKYQNEILKMPHFTEKNTYYERVFKKKKNQSQNFDKNWPTKIINH